MYLPNINLSMAFASVLHGSVYLFILEIKEGKLAIIYHNIYCRFDTI